MLTRPSDWSDEPDEAPPTPIAPTIRESCNVRQTLDELGTARCPLCRAALVARQSRRGPLFFCACLAKPTKRAS
jgi:hypothetical protein